MLPSESHTRLYSEVEYFFLHDSPIHEVIAIISTSVFVISRNFVFFIAVFFGFGIWVVVRIIDNRGVLNVEVFRPFIVDDISIFRLRFVISGNTSSRQFSVEIVIRICLKIIETFNHVDRGNGGQCAVHC